MKSWAGNLKIIGGLGLTSLSGGSGDDNLNANISSSSVTISGGGGSDTLNGGLGNDVFIYNSANESTLYAIDSIKGYFNAGAADTIQLATKVGNISIIPEQKIGAKYTNLNVGDINSLLNSNIGISTKKFIGANNTSVAILSTTDNRKLLAIDIYGSGSFTDTDMLVNVTDSKIDSIGVGA